MKKNEAFSIQKIWIVNLIIVFAGVFLDQLTKILIRANLAEREYIELIPGVFQIYHHENSGATWGMLKGQTVFFIFIGFVAALALIFFIAKLPQGKKYIRLNIALSLILAGDIGNTIDRIQKASVTDFLYAAIIRFPVFNVADMYIVIATFWIFIMSIFIYKEEDLAFLNTGRAKRRREHPEGEQED